MTEPGPVSTPPTPLVGRGPQVAELLVALAGAVKGSGQIVLIEGEAGIGKTVLLAAALQSARSLGFRCLAGAAEELERHRPFGALSDAFGLGRRSRAGTGREPAAGQRLEERRSQLAALIAGEGEHRPAEHQPAHEPGLDLAGNPGGEPRHHRGGATVGRRRAGPGDPLSPGSSEAEFAIVDGLIDYVEQLCAAGPLALAIDDLQWADPSTLGALARLAREIRSLPFVLMATVRPMPRNPALEAMKSEPAVRAGVRLALNPLTVGEVATLAENLLLARPSPALLDRLDRAGGNPFLATELITSYRQEGLIQTVGDLADLHGAAGLPESLAAMIRHRLSFLSDETIHTLEVASVLGSTFSATDLAAVLERPLLAVLDHLHGAVEAGIISGDGRLASFRHDLIRESLYDGMAQAVRHSLHLAAANALLEVGLPAVEVADHVLRGAAPGDLEAVEWLRTAARQAGGRAPAIAADLLARARTLIPEPGPVQDATLAELAEHLVACGRLTEAEEICRSVLADDHDPAVEGTLRLCLVQICVGRGRIGDALPEIDAAIRSPDLTPLEQARLQAWSATCRLVLWDLPGATSESRAALEASRALGDDFGVAISEANLAAVQNLRGDARRGLVRAEAALVEARRSRSLEARRLRLTLMHALMLVDVDALEEAQNALRQGRYARERRGARWNLPTYHFVSAIGRYFSGDWDEAIAQFESAMDFAQEAVVYQGQLVGHSLRSMIALRRGDLTTAGTQLAAAEAVSAGTGPQWRPDWMLWAQALKAESEGRVAEALGTLTSAWRQCQDAGVATEYPVIGPDAVRLALACGDLALAEEVTAALEALAERSGVAGMRGAALRCRGVVNGDPSILQQAVAAYRGTPRRWELAMTCEDAAVVLTGAARPGPASTSTGTAGTASDDAGGGRSAQNGPVRQARKLADEALEIYRSLEADRELARAKARLRAAGLRIGTAGERQGPRQGWEALTAAEEEVVTLVAQGLGNPEIAQRLFVSRHTVQTHVSHILEKLGLTSRVELAVAANRRVPPRKAEGQGPCGIGTEAEDA